MVEAPLLEEPARIPDAERHARSGHGDVNAAARGDAELISGQVRKVHFDRAALGVALLWPGQPWVVLTLPTLAHRFRLTDVRAPLVDCWAAAL